VRAWRRAGKVLAEKVRDGRSNVASCKDCLPVDEKGNKPLDMDVIESI
jgi:hypothetical protein